MLNFERQLQYEVTSSCRRALTRGAERRRALNSADAFRAWQNELLAVFRGAFPAAVFERPAALDVQRVSGFELAHCRIENVLFESLPGWQVNA